MRARLCTSLTAAVAAVLLAAASAAAAPAPRGPVGGPVALRAAAVYLGLEPCPETDPDASCGAVDVPLDRGDPASATVPINFVVLTHRDETKPVLEPVFVILGGPGDPATGSPGIAHYYFDALRGRRDLVLVDYRGEGRSGAIDCPELQHFEGNSPLHAIGACGRQLGEASDRYGAADVADDIDAVREALGYETINFYGLSYGTVHAQAYALRHGEHLRSLILDGALSPLDRENDPFIGTANATAVATTVANVCRRSVRCAQANAEPEAALAWLAQTLRETPLDGVGVDVTGEARTVHVDELALLRIADDPGNLGTFANQGAIVPAAEALQHGDATPLLRLAADHEGPQFTDAGDPTMFSVGLNAAALCSDFPMPFDVTASLEVRQAQYEAFLAALPASAFAPFSATAWDGYYFPDFCIEWPAPDDLEPVFVPAAQFPDVPALVVAGDLDSVTTVEHGRFVADLFPRSRFVVVRNGGHVPGFFAACTPEVYQRFIRTLDAGDLDCLETGSLNRPTVGSYPRLARLARPAVTVTGVDRSRPLDRRVAAVVWATVEDAVRQSDLLPDFAGTGTGLRGGAFATAFDFDTFIASFTLRSARFAEDVAVKGKVTVDWNINRLTARVTVDGPGNADGVLRLRGEWYSPDATTIRITGRLGARAVDVRVPAT